MIYAAVLDVTELGADCEKYVAALPNGVKERIENTADTAVRKLRVGAYFMLSVLYGELSGEKMPEILYTDDGKPYFSGTAEKYTFGISHDGELAAVAVSDSGDEVGVDIQAVPKRSLHFEKIAERFFAPLGKKDRAPQENAAREDGAFCLDERFFSARGDSICEETAESFCEKELTEKEASSDFIARWSVLEALLKLSGGGFGELSDAGEIAKRAKTRTVRIKRGKREYAFTVASAR